MSPRPCWNESLNWKRKPDMAINLPKGFKALKVIHRACCIAKISEGEAWFAVHPKDLGRAFPAMKATGHYLCEKRVRVTGFISGRESPFLRDIEPHDFATLVYATSKTSSWWFALPPQR